MPTNAKELGLGTVFTGKVDSTFTTAVSKLKSILHELTNLQAQIKKTTSGSKTGMTLTQELSDYAKAQGNAVNEMTRYRQALAQVKAMHGETGTAFQTAKGQLNQVERAVQATARSMNVAGQEGKEWAKTIDRTSLMNGILSGDLKATTKGFQSVTAAGQAQIQTMGVAEQQTRKLGTAVQQTGKHAAFMGGQIGWASGTLDRLGRAIKVVAAYSVAGAGFYALTAGIGGATTEIVGFDQALKGVQAITQATTAEIGVMAGVLKGIAKDTKVGPQEAAQAITLLGQAGLEAKESINAIGSTTTLAIGAMAGMEASADLLTTTLMAFNLNAVESGRVADVMANAMNKSKLDVEKLRVAFSYVGSSAAEVGLTLEQTAASMMVLSNAGLRASTIGTGLRQILSKLINPNEKLREAYEAHKISMEAINPLTVGWGEALKNLSSVLWDHQKKTVDMSKAYQIFELRGAQAAAVLVRAFKSGDYKKMLEYTYAIGSANEMAATQMEGLGYKLANLGNQAKLAAISLGEAGLVGVMKVAIDTLRGFISGINSFLSNTAVQMIGQVGAITAAVYGMGKAFQALGSMALANMMLAQFRQGLAVASVAGLTFSTVLGVIQTAFMGLVRFLSGPIGIIAGLVALVLWVSRLASANERLIRTTNEQIVKNESVAESLQSYRGALQSLHERLKSGQDVQLEYVGLLARLKKDHPELAKAVDLTTVSYKNFHVTLDDALKKLLALQARVSSADYAKSIVAQVKEIERLTKVIEGVKKSADAIPNSGQMIVNFQKKLADANTTLEATIQGQVLAYRDLITSGAMTRDQVNELITSTMGFSDEGIRLANIIQGKLGNAFFHLTKDSEEASVIIEGMPAKFKALFNALTPLQKFEFLGDYKSLNSKIASIKKEFKDAKLGGDVKGAITQAEDAFIEDFKRKIDKTKAMATEELRYESILSGLQTDKREKIEQEYTERKALIERFYQQQFDIVNRNETRLAKLKDQVRTLSTENTKKRDYDLAQLDAEIAESKIDLAKTVAMTQVEIAKRGAAEESETKKEAQKKEVEITVTALREIAAVREKFYQDTLTMFGENDARTVEAKQKSAEAQLAIEKAVTSGTIKELNTRYKYDLDMTKKHLLEKYRAGEVSGQEFIRLSRELKEAGQLDEEEFARRQVAVQGTVWEKVKYGFGQSQQSIKTWGEFVIESSTRIADVFASSLTDGFMSFIDRTKTAKEAFADFARSTLKWITEIIAKQLILKAFGGIMSLFGSSPAAGSTVSLSGGSLAPNVAHSGWKVGGGSGTTRRVDTSAFLGAPRFHSGLNPDEFPAILQTGERVLSRRQNARLEASQGALPTSNNAGAEQGAVHLHFDKIQIIANDPLSFAQMIRRDPRTFASMFAEGVTRGDMGIIQSIREATGR